MYDEYIGDHGRRLFGLCQKLCGSREDAEDLYQETWLKAWRFVEKYDNQKEFEGWLTTICINTYRDLLRRQKWKNRFALFRTREEKDLALSNIPAEEGADYSQVHEAVSELPEKYRLAIVLYYFSGLDVKKTAEALSLPDGTVKYRLHRAREILKRRLDPDGRQVESLHQ